MRSEGIPNCHRESKISIDSYLRYQQEGARVIVDKSKEGVGIKHGDLKQRKGVTEGYSRHTGRNACPKTGHFVAWIVFGKGGRWMHVSDEVESHSQR